VHQFRRVGIGLVLIKYGFGAVEGRMTKAAVLDTSLQLTHEWLHEVGSELGFDNECAAYAALRATLHAAKDRLPVKLVAHLGAELPMLVRGMYYNGWHPSARPKAAHDEDFFDSIGADLLGHDELEDVEAVAGAVLRVIDRRIAPGQIARVLDALPEKVRQVWREAQQAEDIQ
jgi:uncharacterized protein (DUF2267 family)